MILFLLHLWGIPIGLNVYLDRNGAKRNYLVVNILRGIALVGHSLLVWPRLTHWWQYPLLFLFQMTSYWLFFEAPLNIVRKRIKQYGFWGGLLYFDMTEHDSGWVDGYFAKQPLWKHRVAKGIALVLFVLSLIGLL